MTQRIVSADPRAGYLAARAEIDAAVARVLAGGTYIHGPEVAAFEAEFARWLGAPAAVGVANGTDALELALRALDVGPGDRVATVANTVTATVAAIVATGARPVYADIDPATMLMDPESLRGVLRRAGPVKVVLPVHLYGLPCDLDAIGALAREHGARVLEDCAQAHGSRLGSRVVGSIGDLAAFSFYPTKNLGAFGDAGAVTGADAARLERVRLLRQYGWRTRYVADEPGRNSRLDELQAAVLRVRLARLEAENAHRARLARRYLDGLAGARVRLPVVPAGRESTWHQFVVRTPARDALRAHLEAQGIFCGVLYPVPVHHQPAHRDPCELPETERACREVLSLPLHLGVGEEEAARVIAAVASWGGA